MTRIFDSKGNDITPSIPDISEMEYVCTMGGEFDETLITLSVYAENLDRDEITKTLGVEPTTAWNPGERHLLGNGKSGKTRITDWGKWCLKTGRNRNPVEPKIRKIFQLCTSDLNSWHTIASKYEIWLTIIAYLDNWNRELDLAPDILQLIAERQLQLKVDVYFNGDKNESEE